MAFKDNIKKMFSEFDEGQKDWFRFDLPDYLHEWVQGGFNRKQLSRNPTLIEEYADHFASLSVTQKLGKLDNLLLALWCIRKCHGPIRAPILRRLTKIPNLNGADTVVIRVKDSLKPITSWTSNTKVVVEDRNPSDADYVIETITAPEPKCVLISMDIVNQFVQFVLKDAAYFGLSQQRKVGKRGLRPAKQLWSEAYKQIQDYLHEKEFLIYLHPHESLRAKVIEHIPDPYKKKKATPKKIKIKPLENPFISILESMNKLTPAQQIAGVRDFIKRLKAAPTPNKDRIMMQEHYLKNMLEYAKLHNLPIV